MEFLSQELGLETRSISNWFHNHRMRLKQNLPQGMDNLALLAAGGRNPEGSPSGPGKNYKYLVFPQKSAIDQFYLPLTIFTATYFY